MESSNQLGNRRAARDTNARRDRHAERHQRTSASAPPTATRRSFPIPTGSTSRGGRTGTAFGTGIHACAGLSLARMEGQVAIEVAHHALIAPAGAPTRSGRARFADFCAIRCGQPDQAFAAAARRCRIAATGVLPGNCCSPRSHPRFSSDGVICSGSFFARRLALRKANSSPHPDAISEPLHVHSRQIRRMICPEALAFRAPSFVFHPILSSIR